MIFVGGKSLQYTSKAGGASGKMVGDMVGRNVRLEYG